MDRNLLHASHLGPVSPIDALREHSRFPVSTPHLVASARRISAKENNQVGPVEESREPWLAEHSGSVPMIGHPSFHPRSHGQAAILGRRFAGIENVTRQELLGSASLQKTSTAQEPHPRDNKNCAAKTSLVGALLYIYMSLEPTQASGSLPILIIISPMSRLVQMECLANPVILHPTLLIVCAYVYFGLACTSVQPDTGASLPPQLGQLLNVITAY